MTIFIISLLLILSSAINILLVWYIRGTIDKLVFVSKNIGHLMDVVLDFKQHLTALSEMELFYGDETIMAMLEHSRFLVDEIDKFEEIFSLTEEDLETSEELIDDREEEEDSAPTEQEEAVLHSSA
tara:strand:+ start:17177 stop:17554 length:378 start_codon:yes stop_codon:yes gene_type:complete